MPRIEDDCSFAQSIRDSSRQGFAKKKRELVTFFAGGLVQCVQQERAVPKDQTPKFDLYKVMLFRLAPLLKLSDDPF